jgi:hypothetical protein
MTGSDLVAPATPAMADRPACLLDPHREVVAFTGRTDAIDALLAWCRDARGDRLRLVTGPGGVGKTRLAVQLGRHVAMLGWSVHWLSGDQEADPSALPAGRASLLVVDDAEQRTGLAGCSPHSATDQSWAAMCFCWPVREAPGGAGSGRTRW